MAISLLEKSQRISVSTSDADPCPIAAIPAPLQSLQSYWQRKKGARVAPSRADIQPEEIPDILPYVMLIDLVGPSVDPGPRRLKYRLIGTEIDRVFGTGMTGRYLEDCDFDGLRALVVADYMSVVIEAAPSWTHWRFRTGQGRLLEYERLALPLSADGSSVDMLLVGIVGEGLGPLARQPLQRPRLIA